MYQIIVDVLRDQVEQLEAKLPKALPAGSWIWWWKQSPLPKQLIIFLTNREVVEGLQVFYDFLHEFAGVWIRKISSLPDEIPLSLIGQQDIEWISQEALFAPLEQAVHFELTPYPLCWEGRVGLYQLMVKVRGRAFALQEGRIDKSHSSPIEVTLLRRGDVWSIRVPIKRSHKSTAIRTINMWWSDLEPMIRAVKNWRQENFHSIPSRRKDGQQGKKWRITILEKPGDHNATIMKLGCKNLKGVAVVFDRTTLMSALRLLRHRVGRFIPTTEGTES